MSNDQIKVGLCLVYWCLSLLLYAVVVNLIANIPESEKKFNKIYGNLLKS